MYRGHGHESHRSTAVRSGGGRPFIQAAQAGKHIYVEKPLSHTVAEGRAMNAWLPKSAVSCGGKFVVDDMADTPDTQEAAWEFPGFVMRYSYRGFNTFHEVPGRPHHHGVLFHGDQASMVLDRSGYEIWEEHNQSKPAETVSNPRFYGDGKPGNEVDGPWQRLFADCVLGQAKPPLDLEESHRATVCCHLANIAYRTGKKLAWDGRQERILDDAVSSKLLARPRRKGYELPQM